MRNYTKEIGELRRDIDELSKGILDIVRKRNVLEYNFRNSCGIPITSTVGTILLNTTWLKTEKVEKLLLEHDQYERLGNELYELRRIYGEKLDKHNTLKDEWRRIHTREFYRPMDEIDICNLISKDGFIIGVKF